MLFRSSRPAAKHLSERQVRFLGKLMRELRRESERVFQVRRRTEENLRQFVESGAAGEMRAVDRLLGRLERLAVKFEEANISLRHEIGLRLNSGGVTIQSPDSLRLKVPEEQLDTRSVEVRENATMPSDAMLEQLHAVQVMQVAERMRKTLSRSRIPLSIGALLERQPIRAGLEELVACLRVARAVGATDLQERETVSIEDRGGRRFKAEIPHFLLSAEQFPEHLEELIV